VLASSFTTVMLATTVRGAAASQVPYKTRPRFSFAPRGTHGLDRYRPSEITNGIPVLTERVDGLHQALSRGNPPLTALKCADGVISARFGAGGVPTPPEGFSLLTCLFATGSTIKKRSFGYTRTVRSRCPTTFIFTGPTG